VADHLQGEGRVGETKGREQKERKERKEVGGLVKGKGRMEEGGWMSGLVVEEKGGHAVDLEQPQARLEPVAVGGRCARLDARDVATIRDRHLVGTNQAAKVRR